ncbi:acyclic terpene utilization AtuA family protein [Jiella avicenniae]|uniref:DUF1446 domain-containing protein n=1 Tax=Jiella avicenniae TaxID=2907202 RepID=A0A9X1P5L0_9HYPH|nr:acyclic terpene utilization AtuA family protein [Jiella avicenniae]MCE7029646.1 DUF1446 domain-containing protein [Jiella avicenniae]
MKTVRIGAGAGFGGDRIDPAVALARDGALDYLVFECLAERTIALAQLARVADPSEGYDKLLERRIRAVLPDCLRNGTRIVTNMGAANPWAAAQKVAETAADMGLTGVKVAAVLGDDVLGHVAPYPLDDTGMPAEALGTRLVSANAYIGSAGIVDALQAGAQVVICGRAADPALFLGPLAHEFGWASDDWERLGRGTLVGHLLECAAQITGGYFADPGLKDVPDLANVGYPLAEVGEDGNAVITKLPGTGGQVTLATCTEQLLYEIHDPARYLQPDVVADFSNVDFTEIGPDRVAVSGGAGHPRPETLKVSVGSRDGWIGQGEISYAGPGAVARGRLAADILKERLLPFQNAIAAYRSDLIGVDSILPGDSDAPPPREVRLRCAARCDSREVAETVADEVETLYLCGPAGGGGVTRSLREVIGIRSTFMPRSEVEVSVRIVES